MNGPNSIKTEHLHHSILSHCAAAVAVIKRSGVLLLKKQNEITLRDKILYDIVKLQLSSEPLGHSQCSEMRTNEQNFLENLGLHVEQL